MSTSDLRPYHHGDLREKLVRASLDLLHQGGVAGLTLRGAARAAGASAMAPYRHFADKDALIAAVVTRGFADLREQLLAARKPGAQDSVVALGIAYVAFAAAQPALFRLMFGPHPEKPAAGSYPPEGTAFTVLEEAVAQCDPQASLAHRRERALGCWSLVHGIASLLLDERLPAEAGPPAEITGRLIRLFIR